MSTHNDVSDGLNRSITTNIDEIIQEIQSESGFFSEDLIGESKWWNSEVAGAKHFSGIIDGKPAVLKLQLVKIDAPEVTLIENYHKFNKSSHIRAPYIYYHKPWDDNKNYEAIIMEKVEKVPVINYPSNIHEIEEFHFYFKEYKLNTDVSDPWLDLPEERSSVEFIEKKFAKWKDMRSKVTKNTDVLTETDEALIADGIKKLVSFYTDEVELEFVHGHFGPQDLSKVDKDKAVVFSNLYWSWRYPYYDLVFGFHYFKYFLANTSSVTREIYMTNSQLWQECMVKTAKSLSNFDEKTLNAAILERLLAGLNLDYLTVGRDKPMFNILLDETRAEISKYIKLI
ncbi:hypothetical protein A2619_01825 [candidate division WWE3 bacterium RIFOXYD1_FULL_39_9]|uniref:Aminoglycoside phosphotransferase domain-containing protein n=1 Tax=candidate division WWE3 bacterium RIFOXYD1_FULL_39_9 TaxID=1802649 RepID=A0A1F4X950_UNCKA|nr:MAG: hypothetical protein A2619_01825 [candidate division WWE3 bacterium RIFOXYD1_FULL_39_9]